MPPEVTEYRLRVGRLQKKLQSLDLEAALITQMADLYYLSGTGQNCHFFVPAAGEPLLLAYKNADRARAESAWEQVYTIRSFKEIPEYIKAAGWTRLLRLGVQMDVVSWAMGRRYQQLFPGSQWYDISNAVRGLRMVKSAYELELVRDSAAKHRQVFRHISEFVRPGQSEMEIASEFERYARQLGNQGTLRYRGEEQGMRFGLVVAGVNSTQTSRYSTSLSGVGISPLYPSSASWHRWEAGEPLMIDYGSTYNEYIVDITRVYLDEAAPAILQKAQETAEEIAAAVAAAARPGAVTGELYELAVSIAVKRGFGEHFMGYGRQAPFVGHGVGLELNELPVLARGDKTVLDPGMVFALEPKFVFPNLGSVGTEDTYVVTPTGAESLTS